MSGFCLSAVSTKLRPLTLPLQAETGFQREHQFIREYRFYEKMDRENNVSPQIGEISLDTFSLSQSAI
jgi:hypothetical protein